jgi:uncharacterized membrane protein YjfL (UPF0719 family)
MNDLKVDIFLSTLAYAGLGIALFALTFWLCAAIAPFSIRKEIEEDQNTALAILIGSVFIGISMIIGAAIG